jgi:methionyl-tRNA formyltransferase
MSSSAPLSIVYFGTAPFSVAPLRALLARPAEFRVVAVVTQPDRPAGRDGVIRRSPIALLSDEYSLPLLQFESLKFPESHEVLRRLSADFFVVAAYGLIIPQAVLDIPKFAALNLHGSILPKYRGASPIQEALKNGDSMTGVTLMRMDAKVDHGPVYGEVEVPIAADDTHASLEVKLGEAAAPLLTDSLPLIAVGKMQAVEQDHAAATFTKLIKKDDGLVRWHELDAVAVERLLRAYTPWPGIYTTWEKVPGAATTRLKLLGVEAMDGGAGVAPGTVFVSAAGELCVKAREGAVRVATVQPEGKGAMPGKAFLAGNAAVVGAVLR